MHPSTSQDISVAASSTVSETTVAKKSEAAEDGDDIHSNNTVEGDDVHGQKQNSDGGEDDGDAAGFTSQKTMAYDATAQLLESQRCTEFLAPFTSVVNLRNAVTEPPVLDIAGTIPTTREDGTIVTTTTSLGSGSGSRGSHDILDYEDIVQQHPLPRPGGIRGGVLRHPGLGNSSSNNNTNNAAGNVMAMHVPSLLTPNRGHHALFRALEEFESLEKQETTIQLRTPLTKSLTEVVTGESYMTPNHAIEDLEALSQSVPRRVCQHPFKKNDIVWVCRTCQADETCVLCHACFKASNHDGHDVAFYHAQAGGCVRSLLLFVYKYLFFLHMCFIPILIGVCTCYFIILFWEMLGILDFQGFLIHPLCSVCYSVTAEILMLGTQQGFVHVMDQHLQRNVW
jgi:Putative zinc finger in N-recognin (UBR box)